MSGEDRDRERPRCGEDAAAYALGALEPAEAEAFRGTPGRLRRLSEGGGGVRADHGRAARRRLRSIEVPKDLRRRVLSEVRATPKAQAASRKTPRALVAPGTRVGGAFAAAAVVLVVLVVALSSGGSSTRTIQASAGSAELQITDGHGDLIVHRLPQLPTGRIYEMWVQRGSAAPTPTGTLFAVRANGSAAVGVPGSLSGVSAVLVTQEPAGGTLAPTSAPVIITHVT